ncbi:zinc finger protein 135-like isoform X2 [Diprion similis]|uniref:zinc finger protein 135-like isoform X2 n=1 Tax=Diprion similis TaxID=362088 RepID=UPI001EF7B286|nr:zinc finger protein 135-like isoform X2 [Diprion similis]
MGSLSLICPMCCGETFNNPQSLKYHLLSITDNLYCPGCSQRFDSVSALIQHLDHCGQSPKSESEVLMEGNVEQISKSFLATVKDGDIMIVGEPSSIQVGDNEFNVMEKMDVEERQVNDVAPVTKDQKLPVPSLVNEPKRKSPTPNPLVELTTVEANNQDADKNLITILSGGPELMDNEDSNLMSHTHSLIEDVDGVEDINNPELLHVKQEICEVKLEELEADALYSCSSCGMSFNSVLEHIKEFHDGQEVVLEMAEPPLENLPTPASITPPQEPTPVPGGRQRQTMNTLRTEECVDSEGRLYTRKVVQIERFWDRPTSSPPPAKAPMIEKFFSNVEGVKVRDKNLPPGPTRMYRCNQCLEHFAKLGGFRVHVCLRGNNQCSHCDQAFATARALQLHTKVHDSETDGMQRLFVCSTCGTEFSSHKSLRLHSRMHAPVRARHVDAPEGTHSATFTCPECGKVLSESYRVAHMALHSGGSVTCTICNRKFESADSLAMHAAVHTEPNQSHSPTPPRGEGSDSVDAQKPYQCQHCSRRFARPHEKVKHERIHTGEKPHACEVCGKTFRVSYCLTLHMRTHTGVRPYVCQHCGKRFKASSVYNHHLLTHGEERAYTCPYCPKTFKTRVQLAGHKNSHTKPFRCTECSRPFASLYAARAHIQTHKKDNNLKFSCFICGASYGRAFALKDHLKQHGQDISAPPEPSREEEVHEGENFMLPEEEVDDDDLVIPSPLPVAQSSEADESD